MISISDFEEMLCLPRIGKARNGLYIFSQGISNAKIKKIKNLIADNNIHDIFVKEYSLTKEQHEYVHKKLSENVMISKPLSIGSKFFVSSLMIDDACAEMSDHLTGQHVQGMVLLESARQMILSIGENFFLSDEERFKSYFVLNSIEAQFKQFIFPIGVDLHCTINGYKKLGRGKFTAKCVIEFMQNNISCLQITIQFMADEKIKLEKKEEKLAAFSIQLAVSKEEENLKPTVDKLYFSNRN